MVRLCLRINLNFYLFRAYYLLFLEESNIIIKGIFITGEKTPPLSFSVRNGGDYEGQHTIQTWCQIILYYCGDSSYIPGEYLYLYLQFCISSMFEQRILDVWFSLLRLEDRCSWNGCGCRTGQDFLECLKVLNRSFWNGCWDEKISLELLYFWSFLLILLRMAAVLANVAIILFIQEPLFQVVPDNAITLTKITRSQNFKFYSI